MALVRFDSIQASQSIQTLQSFLGTGNTAGNTTVTGGDIYFQGGNNMTISMTNNTVVFSAGAAGGLTNVNVSAGTTSNNLSNIVFSNSNGVTFGLNGSTITASVAAGGGLTNINVSAGTTSNNLSALTFNNGNGVTFGLDASTITASHNGITTGRASNDAIGLNTAQSNVTWTVNSLGLSLDAIGYAGTATTFNGANISGSITLNSKGLNLSLSGATAAPSPVNISAGTTSNNLGSIVFTNANGISFGLGTGASSQSITASYNSTQFAGVGTSATNASVTLNSNGLAISIGGYTAFSAQNRQLGASSTIAPGQSWLWLSPNRLPAPVSASTMFGMLSLSGTITSAATAQFGASLFFGIWSQHSTDSNRFDTYWTGGKSFTAWNSGTSSYSYAYDTYNGNSAGSNLGTASVMGLRQIKMDIGSIIPAGLYIFGSMMITSTAGYSAAMSRAVAVFDNPLPVGMGAIGSASNTSIGYVDGGRWSVQTAALPNTISIGHIVQSSNVMPYFKIGAL